MHSWRDKKDVRAYPLLSLAKIARQDSLWELGSWKKVGV